MYHLYLLGSPSLDCDQIRIEFDTRKSIALLAYLVINERIHHRDSLAAMFWPEYDQYRSRAALRRTLSVLRKGFDKGILNITREDIGIISEAPLWCDAREFAQRISEVDHIVNTKGVNSTDSLPILERALELYQGHFMAGFSLRDSINFDDWQLQLSERYKSQIEDVYERLSRLYANAGNYDRAIYIARQWLVSDPIREEAHRQLMLIYSWSGQRTAALNQYRECVRILESELKVPPLEETTNLYQAIHENRQPIRPDYPSDSSEGYVLEPESTSHLNLATVREVPTKQKEDHLHFPLVGRSHETTLMLRIYEDEMHRNHFLVVQGEPGIGKTRLVEDFITYAQSRGSTVMQARCYPGEEDLAYAPFVAALKSYYSNPATVREEKFSSSIISDLSRLLPEMHEHFQTPVSPIPGDNVTAQLRFFEAIRTVITRTLTGNNPGILFFDDFHFADTASIQLLTYIVRRLVEEPILIVFTCRQEELPHNLERLIVEMHRAGDITKVNLKRLNNSNISDLVRYTMERSLPSVDEKALSNYVQRLYEETEGIPFFVIEYLNSIPINHDKTGAIVNELNRDSFWPIPINVQDLIQNRLEDLNETSRQILTTAAVIGRSFDFNTLHEASGRSETETVFGLEQLLAMNIIHELDDTEGGINPIYDFSHGKYRQVVYDNTNLARRRLLHRRVAEVLAKVPQPNISMILLVSQIARHYQLAGQELLAAESYKKAGDQAGKVFAFIEAIHQYQTSLALGYKNSAELQELIGDLQTLSGQYNNALQNYQSAAASVLEDDIPRIEQKLGNVYHRRGEWEIAVSHFILACTYLEDQLDSPMLTSIYSDWSRTAYHMGQDDQARSLANKAESLAESIQDRLSLAKAHNILGILARSDGDLAAAEKHLLKSLELAKAINDSGLETAILNNLSLVYNQIGDLPIAIQFAKSSLEKSLLTGDRHRQAALYNHLADLHHETGQAEIAMEYLKKAVVIFSEIGEDSGSQRPEIWMLTEW